jgi:hypothetical protein
VTHEIGAHFQNNLQCQTGTTGHSRTNSPRLKPPGLQSQVNIFSRKRFGGWEHARRLAAVHGGGAPVACRTVLKAMPEVEELRGLDGCLRAAARYHGRRRSPI